MAKVCPACERSGCGCPVCNGTGRAPGRGYTTPCHHCRGVLIERLRVSLAAARKVIEAADKMRGDTCLGNALEAYDDARAAFAELDERSK